MELGGMSVRRYLALMRGRIARLHLLTLLALLSLLTLASVAPFSPMHQADAAANLAPESAQTFYVDWNITASGKSSSPGEVITHRTAERLAAAITEATTSRAIQVRAATLGRQIRAEDGVGTTVALLDSYRH
jgi:hypothetical protein